MYPDAGMTGSVPSPGPTTVAAPTGPVAAIALGYALSGYLPDGYGP
ncbi:MAG TPA: hypothetical protein VGD29_13375 [Actinoplanes sp.]|jgi:hypothetical protein